jgi:hypothetical protein
MATRDTPVELVVIGYIVRKAEEEIGEFVR